MKAVTSKNEPTRFLGGKVSNQKITVFALIVLMLGLAVGAVLVTQLQTFDQQAATPICPANGAACRWAGTEDNLTFHYVITDLSDNTIIKQGTTSETQVFFTPIVGRRYSCQVTPVNTCGRGPTSTTQSTCSGQDNLPTPTTSTTPMTPTPIGQIITLTPAQVPIILSPSPSLTTLLSPIPTVTPSPLSDSPTGSTPTPAQVPIILSPSPSPTTLLSPTPAVHDLPNSGTAHLTLAILTLSLTFVAIGAKLIF